MNITKNQEYELLASISGRGEIPTKFIYLDGGAERWDKVHAHRSEGKGIANAELVLLLSHIESFMNAFKGFGGINLIDLGCGNGKPAVSILRQLLNRKFEVVYTAVDLSDDMLKLATDTVAAEFPNLEIGQLSIDFEKESLTDELLNIKQKNNYPNLLINLGNTLGNYINANSVLSNFLESMTLDDYLLIGNGLVNDYNPQKIMEAYEVNILFDLAITPARLLGVYDDIDDFRWVWNPGKNRVEGRIKLNTGKTITLADQKVHIDKGDEILVLQSYKYSESSITKLLSDVGFRTELLTTTKDRGHILTMVQPTRYSVA